MSTSDVDEAERENHVLRECIDGIQSSRPFFIGLLGEYILSINQRVMRRPLVVEEERLNFPEDAMIGGMADASK